MRCVSMQRCCFASFVVLATVIAIFIGVVKKSGATVLEKKPRVLTFTGSIGVRRAIIATESVSCGSGLSGTARAYRNIMYHADKHGIPLLIVEPQMPNTTQMHCMNLSTVAVAKYQSYPLGAGQVSIGPWAMDPFLEKVFTEYQPTVIVVVDLMVHFAGTFTFPGVVYAQRRAIPSIAYAHSRVVDAGARTTTDDLFVRLGQASQAVKEIYHSIEFAGLAAYDLTLVNSHGMKNYIESHSSRFVNVVVRNPGLACAVPGKAKFGRSRRQQNRTHHKMLYAGRISGDKRIDMVVETFKLVAQKIENVKLVVAGNDNGDLWRIRDLIDDYPGMVKYIGVVPESSMQSILEDADVLLFPGSHADTWARIVYEAACAGLPVIAAHGAVWTESKQFPHVHFAPEDEFAETVAKFFDGHLGPIDFELWQKFLQDLPSEAHAVEDFFVKTALKIQS